MTASDLTQDERGLLRAAQSLRLVRTGAWPGIAAELLARGLDGDATAELAGLSATDSAWSIEPLVPDVLSEVGGEEPDQETASRLVARAMARVARRHGDDSYPTIRALAALSPGLDYPGGTIGEAYYLDEWLDCDCHEGSPERQRAAEFEQDLAQQPLDADDALLTAVTSGWV